MPTYGNRDDLNAAKADDWLHRATQDTESFLRGLGWSGSQPKDEAPALDIRLPTAEEYHASAPWRDLDPVKPSAAAPEATAAPAAASGVPGQGFTRGPAENTSDPRFNRPGLDTSGTPPSGDDPWGQKAYAAAVKAGHPNPSEFVEQMRWESGNFAPDVISGQRNSVAGAQGIAQIMPATAQGWGVNPLDPDAALAAAARAMTGYYTKYGDSEHALAAYNMGESNLNKYGPRGLDETNRYIDIVHQRTGRGAPAPTAAPATDGAAATPAAAMSSPPSSAAGASSGDMISIQDRPGRGGVRIIPRSQYNASYYDPAEWRIVDEHPVTMQKMSDTMPADEGGPSAGEQKRQKMAAMSGADTSPQPMPGSQGPYDQNPPTLPGVTLLPGAAGPGTSAVPNAQDEIDRRTAGQMYRQPLQATSGPDSSTGADPSSSYNDPTEGGTLSQPLPSYTGDGFPDPSGGGTSAPGMRPSSSSPSPDRPSPANDPGGAQQPAPFTPPTGLQAVYDAAGNFLHWIQGAAQGAADQIGQNMAANRQTIETANAGQSGGVDFGTGAQQAASDVLAPAVQKGLEAGAATGESFSPGGSFSAVGQQSPLAAAFLTIQSTAQAFGDEAARRVATRMGIPDDVLVTILGHPITKHDVAGFIGASVADPASYLGAHEGPAAIAAVKEAAPEVAGVLGRGAESVGSRIRGAIDANAANVAAADARMAESGSTAAHGTLGVVTGNPLEASTAAGTRVIPPHVADTLDFPVRVPTDPAVVKAIEAAGGSVDPNRGVNLNVIRMQGPEAAGKPATRSSTFYTADKPGTRSPYEAPAGAQTGGNERIEAPTTYRSPLVLDAAPGDARGFDLGMEALGKDQAEAVAQARRDANDAWARVRDAESRYGYRAPETQQAQEALRATNAEVERLRPAEVATSAAVDEGIESARRAGPPGSPERAQALKDLVNRYGGDESVIDDLVALRGGDDSESAWAIKENILAHNARAKGYDGVLTVQPGEADHAEIAKHPLFVAAQKTLDDAQAARLEAIHNGVSIADRRPLEDAVAKAMTDGQVAWDQAAKELSTHKITELADFRESHNPTPGGDNPALIEAETRLEQAMARAKALGPRDPAFADAFAAVEAANLDRRRVRAEGLPSTPPGYTLRPDIPRRGGQTTASATTGVVPQAGRGTGALNAVTQEAGRVVAGGVGGASIGAGAPADTPEERRRNALIGAGVGMVAGPLASRAIRSEGGALATFGASPNYRPPTPAQVQRAAQQGERRGQALNQTVKAPPSAVPRGVRAATRATDDRAALRWSEDMLTDTAGTPRLRENDPARPSTQSRVNAGSVANERIDTELAPAVQDAATAGLQNDLPRFLEDTQHRDILNEFYGRGHQEAIDAGEKAAAEAVDRVDKVVKQRLQHAENRAKGIESSADKIKQETVKRIEDEVKQRLDYAEGQAVAYEKAGRPDRAESVRRTAQANASQTLARAQEVADARVAQLPAQADEVRRVAQENASQTMTRAQEQADKLKATTEQADKAGTARMRQRQGSNAEHAYEATDARLQEQEQRLTADGRWQQLQDAAQAIWDHNAATRQRLVDSGNLSQETADELAAKYPHYVPTVPISHLTEGAGPVASSGTTVSRGTKPSISALEDVGTSGERLNPIVASRNSTVSAERDIQRNNVATAFAQMMDDALKADPKSMATDPATHRTFLGGGKDVTYRENGNLVTLNVPPSVADGLEAAANMGADPNAAGRIWRTVMGTVTSAMTAGRASFLPVNLLRDMQDYATRTAAKEGGPQQIPGVMGTWMNEAGKAAADIARAQLTGRGYVGAALGAAAGAVQGDDQTTVGERARHAVEGGIAGTFIGGANKVRATGKAAEYLARGGGSGGVSAHWIPGQRWYRDVLRDGGAPIKSAGDAARYLGDWMQDVATLQGVKGINERTELISRTAAMTRADTQGLAPTEAMLRGRDASYDPDRSGTVARMLNGWVPFFNASVQNSAQFVRLFKQNPVAATATIAATTAPVMLAVEAWNRSDPTRAQVYDDIPQYVKDSGIVTVMPWAGSDNRGDRPNYLWQPTGVQTPFIMAMREAMSKVPELQMGPMHIEPTAGSGGDWADTLGRVLGMFSPVRGDSVGAAMSNLVPQVVKQGVELAVNRDLYRGNPIETGPADERASAASKWIAEGSDGKGGLNAAGRAIGNDFLQEIHPSQVEHVMRSLPAYSDIVSGASDMVKPSGYKQAEDRPIQNEPFVGGIAGRFIRDTGGANLQRAQDDNLPESVRAIFEEAGMRPSAMGTVPGSYKNAPLTREEQQRWQTTTNQVMGQTINQVRRDPKWRDPSTREQAVRDAMAAARDLAAQRALRNLTDREIERRKRADQTMKAS